MTPGQLTDILDAGLSISDEEKANLNGKNMTIQRNHPYSSLSDEDRLRQETLLKSYFTVYNYGDNMKLIFEGKESPES